MLFNSLTFLVFAAIFFPLYFATAGRVRLWVCLIASYIFYGWWDWRFLGLIVGVTVVNYLVGLRIARQTSPRHRKFLLFVGCFVCLGVLGLFKYFNFFVDSFFDLLGALGVQVGHYDPLRILLPVGISFYTFQAMSYTFDVYRGVLPVEPSLLRFATYIAFFPQLVAGPIVRAADFVPQLYRDHPFNWERFVSGFLIALWGYMMKVGIADSLALVSDTRFAVPEAQTSLSLMIGVLFYAFQIYCDFAGYSGIAIGVARMLGYDFMTNFDRPYFSASFSEFWQRWHISLSTWLRDYLYIPLGGNRHGPFNTYRNLMLTMLLGGLWHGANWTFVAWGALHGLYLVVQRLLGPWWRRLMGAARVPVLAQRMVLVPLVFLLTCLAWVFFRSPNFEVAWIILRRIASFDDLRFSSVGLRFEIVKGLMLILGLWILELLSFRVNAAEALRGRPVLTTAAALAMLWVLALVGTFSSNAFIYFQF